MISTQVGTNSNFFEFIFDNKKWHARSRVTGVSLEFLSGADPARHSTFRILESTV
jgi:hypothetical protein